MPTGYTPPASSGSGVAPTVVSAYDNVGTGYQTIGTGSFIITGLKNGTYHFDTSATSISECAWKDNNGRYNSGTGFVDVEGRVSVTVSSPNTFTPNAVWDGAISDGRLTIIVSGAPAGLTGMISCVLA